MFNEYDEITIDELKGISNDLAEIKQLISVQNQLLRSNNLLLRKQLMSKNAINYVENIPKDYSSLLNKNISLVCPCKKRAISFAKELADAANSNLIISKACKEGEVAAEINGAQEGDYIFIDLSENIYYEKLEVIISDVCKESCINFHFGVGETARDVRFDVPPIKFIVHSYDDELVPEWIENHFEKLYL